MKSLIVTALVLWQVQASADEINLDKIKSVSCIVTSADVRSSFMAPIPGDKMEIAIWALDISDLHFESRNYVSSEVGLERVDRDGFRSESIRTWMGIRESFAELRRAEYILVIDSKNGESLKATYSVLHKSLESGATAAGDLVKMNCVASELW